MTTSIGQNFKTGETAPVSGVYRLVKHIDGTVCTASPDQQHIPLTKGETFPPCRKDNKGVIWSLERYA